MKKLISLFLVVAMLSSFAIVASAETKVNLNVQWLGTKAGFGGSVSVDMSNMLTTANPGDTIAAFIYTPANTYLSGLGFYVKYDNSILTYKSATFGAGWTGTTGDQGNGVLKVGAATAAPTGADFAEFGTILFTVNAAPVKTKDDLIVIEVDGENANTYNPAGGATTPFAANEMAVTFSDLTINGVQVPAKEFEVTAVEEGNDVVVTVANKGDKTGFVYVANYVGGVLDNCEVKALADGELTFTGLAGDAKVFVWDANNAPILDAAIEL